jgi:chemotaxis protein histidine kinase CheA
MADAKAKLVAEVVGEYSAGRMFSAANKDMARTAKQGKALNNQMRIIRGGVGQLGHQIQDVAVQFQGGQSPFLILGQQGSQIASLMGPHGAVVGAFLAIGAAIAGSMLPNLFGATEALKELEKEGESLVDRFDELDGVLKAEALRLNAQEMDNLREVIADSEEEIRNLAKGMKMVNALSTGQADRVKEVTDAIQAEAVIITLANEALEKRAKLTDDTSNATEKLIEKVEKEAEALGKTKSELILLDEAYKDANETDKKRIEVAAKKIKTYEDEVAAQKELAKEKAKAEAAAKAQAKSEEARAKAEKARAVSSLEGLQESLLSRSESIDYAYSKELAIIQTALDERLLLETQAAELTDQINAKRAKSQEELAVSTASDMISLTSTMVSSMQGMVDEGSALGKAFFVISQALAAADAIVKGYQTASAIKLAYAEMAAATGNPALAAVGDAHAAMAVGMGFATAGMIAGQTLASFEGGGLTGSGARSGGMDGKGGMLAMLHPNEKITDLQKGQSESKVVHVNFNIQANDTAGFDRLLNSRRGQIVNMINQAVNDRGRPSIA